ncbi:hypothetical protein [Pseudonocardia xishanensis]|uniref:hypothetical protein n=1 Tax=Pseudonocardia xishanensis TaxID=630995 RepID=UPI0031E88FA3
MALSDKSPAAHRTYNEWHQLDHRPENLRLPGVAWGDRWSRTSECAATGRDVAGEPDARFADVDYMAMYWFRQPSDESVAAWSKLGENSFQWGRGPILPGVARPLLAFFTPVLGYVSPRVPVSAETLPFRPNRGLHVTLTQLDEPHGASAHEQFHWLDTVRMPDLLDVPGVAGAWTFSLLEPQRHASLPLDAVPEYPRGSLRVTLLYLDDEPETVTREVAERTVAWDADGRGAPAPAAERVLFCSPLRTIIPWQDW